MGEMTNEKIVEGLERIQQEELSCEAIRSGDDEIIDAAIARLNSQADLLGEAVGLLREATYVMDTSDFDIRQQHDAIKTFLARVEEEAKPTMKGADDAE